MQKLISGWLVIIFSLPILASAHAGMMEFGNNMTTQETMRYIEDGALGTELHEEMEDLMTKMLSGTLNQPDAERMTELMNQYPGPYAMMTNRMMGARYGQDQKMMPWSTTITAGLWFWLMMLIPIVWLIVGVLAIILLWKRIR